MNATIRKLCKYVLSSMCFLCLSVITSQLHAKHEIAEPAKKIQSDSLRSIVKAVFDHTKEESALIDILSTPFFTGIIALLASIVGFWFNDFLNQRNNLREYKNKIINDFSRVLTLTIMYSNQLKIKEIWVNFYNACKTHSFEPLFKEQIMKEHQRLDYLSDELLKLAAELNGLVSQFEFKILRSQDVQFNRLLENFQKNKIKFQGMDFDEMNQAQLHSIQPKLSEMAAQQITQFKPQQEHCLNAIINYINKKVS